MKQRIFGKTGIKLKAAEITMSKNIRKEVKRRAKMKILAVCQYYYPENFQITPICEQLARDGYEVTVLTGLPNYPAGVIPDEYRAGRRDEVINGVRVIRCNEIGRKKGAVCLALNYFSFVYSASKMAEKLDGGFDVVFVYQLSPVLMGLPAMKYSKKHKVPLFLYCCDLWPESVKMYLRGEKNPIFMWARNKSRKIYSSADKIACQSGSFLPYLKGTHGIRDEKLMYIPAFADETYLSADFTPEDGTVDFVFLGNLGIAQNLTGVLQAVRKIRDVPGFKVHFVGDGSMLDEMKKYARAHRLEDIVVFYGRRPVDEMPKYYKLADACLVSLNADNAVGLTLPSKVQGYMAAGKPVIGMISGPAKEVIDESNCGICVNAGDIDGLAAAMREFIVEKEKFKDCGKNGREYFKEHFRKNIVMGRLEDVLDSLAGVKGRVRSEQF